MKPEIRVLIFGAAGEQGRNFTELLVKKNVKIVGAIGRNNHIGEDIGIVNGVGKLGVPLMRLADLDLDAYLDEIKPTVAIDCVGNVDEIYDYARVCVRHGVNMLLIGMDCLYPFAGKSKALAEDLDKIAKEHDATLCGCGVQDVGFINMLSALTATCIDLKGVTLENYCNLAFAGPYQLTGLSINATPEEFETEHKDDEPRCDLYWAAYEIAKELGLHVISEDVSMLTPMFAKEDFVTKYVGTIKKGNVIGCRNHTELLTKEGIYVKVKHGYDFRDPETEPDPFRWFMDGYPEIRGELYGGDAGVSTAVEPLWRIPDIINAKPGFLTLADLPKPYFKNGDLNDYVNEKE